MQKFTNPNVKKEQNKNIRNLVIGIILIVISLLFKYQEGVEIDKASKEMTDLNSIIVSEGDKDGKMAYLDAMSIPYMFAGYDDTTDSYYMVFDDKYLYVVYMSESDFEELNTESIYDTAIRIEGITKSTPSDVKEIAIEVYNESMENEEDKLTLADFDSYFGSVYLDMTVSSPDSASTPLAFFFLFFIFGIIILIVAIVSHFRFSRNIKKLTGVEIDELDNEMNDKNAFYYSKVHLYLTEHYIINFAGIFKAIRYDDILWMYPFVQRTNGVKSAQSIKVLTKEGKNYTVASIEVISKQKKEIYNEIWNTIVSKNQNMLIGYTQENIKAMNEKVKEIKKSKKI